MNWPFRSIDLAGLAGKFKYMQFLHDGSEIRYRATVDDSNLVLHPQKGSVVIDLPVVKPNVEVPVVEIFLK